MTPPTGLTSLRVGVERLHADTNLDFQLNRLCSDGSDELVREVREVASCIESLSGWVTAMEDLARRAESVDRIADAARYVRAAEFFLSPARSETSRLRSR
jgi:hypothetical protein